MYIKLEKYGWVCSSYGWYTDESTGVNYSTADRHVWKCGQLGTINVDDESDWSSTEYWVYPRLCKECGANYYDMNSANDGLVWKCCHYLEDEFLICTKNTSGSQSNYNF